MGKKKKTEEKIQAPNILVFVYGTLQRGQRLHALMECADPKYQSKFMGKAVTEKAEYYMGYVGFPVVWEKASKTERANYIEGEVYAVTLPLLNMLDRAESEGSLYYRRRVRVKMEPDGDKNEGEVIVECYWYVINAPVTVAPFASPSAQSLAFPRDYRAITRRWDDEIPKSARFDPGFEPSMEERLTSNDKRALSLRRSAV